MDNVLEPDGMKKNKCNGEKCQRGLIIPKDKMVHSPQMPPHHTALLKNEDTGTNQEAGYLGSNPSSNH